MIGILLDIVDLINKSEDGLLLEVVQAYFAFLVRVTYMHFRRTASVSASMMDWVILVVENKLFMEGALHLGQILPVVDHAFPFVE
jgi:hypothetical protein